MYSNQILKKKTNLNQNISLSPLYKFRLKKHFFITIAQQRCLLAKLFRPVRGNSGFYVFQRIFSNFHTEINMNLFSSTQNLIFNNVGCVRTHCEIDIVFGANNKYVIDAEFACEFASFSFVCIHQSRYNPARMKINANIVFCIEFIYFGILLRLLEMTALTEPLVI